MTNFGRGGAPGQERVEVGEALAEALPPHPLAHDVPEPRAARGLRRRRRRHGGSLLVPAGRRRRVVRSCSGRRGVVTDNASQVTKHPPVHVPCAAGAGVAAAAHHRGLQRQRRRALLLVRLERGARQRRCRRWRREDQAEARQVILVVALAEVEERIRHGRRRRALRTCWRAAARALPCSISLAGAHSRRPRLYTYRRRKHAAG